MEGLAGLRFLLPLQSAVGNIQIRVVGNLHPLLSLTLVNLPGLHWKCDKHTRPTERDSEREEWGLIVQATLNGHSLSALEPSTLSQQTPGARDGPALQSWTASQFLSLCVHIHVQN